MYYQLFSYFKFLVKSTNKHGIHSPFVFDFTYNCLDKKLNKSHPVFQSFLSYKNQLKSDKTSIEVNDFGAGSKHFKSNHLIISDMEKYAGISNIKAKLLIKIIDYFKPLNVLELGTSLGLSTLILSQQNQSNVITIEGCPETSNFAKSHLKQLGLNSISFITSKFSKILPKMTSENKFDFIYFDGNHQKEATLDYFNQCLKTTHNDSLFIFDDIYLSKEMQEAWREMMAHPKVSVSIDLFHFGLLFFRTEQSKQYFYIRTKT
ncbi:MAG: class I SAM-dependent methyltransferase [Flavobacteriales bacterium]|nr:class I SAM-dependent methyltransferase [Flavobacteriales bacterium]